MAILEVGGFALLPHSAGGAIIAKGGAYLAGTYVGPQVVAAFTTAASALSQMSATAASVASAPATLPVLAGVAAIAVVAGSAYCYFHGIPAPVVEMLSSTGFGATGAKGFAVSTAKLAPALIALGVAGFLSYVVYKDFKSFKADYENRVAQPTGRIDVDAHAYPYAFDDEGKRRQAWHAWLISILSRFSKRRRRGRVWAARP